MTKKYKTYSKEFKQKAVHLAEQSDKSVADVARELGIRINQVYKWKQQFAVKVNDVASDTHAINDNAQQLDKDAEIDRLKSELSRVHEENQILKKAAAYFARELN